MDLKNVLVPVDFSPPSTLAVNHGIALARRFHSKVTLLHVVETPSALLYTFPIEAERVEKQRCGQAEKMLPALVGPQGEGLDVRYLVKVGDDIEAAIVSAIHEEQADAIVMGTHGRGFAGRLLIGSVAQSILRKAGIPVLTVCHVSRPLDFKKILFATDFGDASDEGFRFALDLAGTVHSSLVVAHVIDKRPAVTYETPEVKQVFDEDHRKDLDHSRQKFAKYESEGIRQNVKVELVLSEGEAADALVRIADENNVDFVVLGVRTRGSIARAFLGSTAEPVVRAAHVPVLCVPIRAAG